MCLKSNRKKKKRYTADDAKKKKNEQLITNKSEIKTFLMEKKNIDKYKVDIKQKFSENTQDAVKFCTRCGIKFSAKDRYCGSCGMKRF